MNRPLPPLTPSQVTRFWKKVQGLTDPTACWLWTGAKTGTPPKCLTYGYIAIKPHTYRAHRVAFYLSNGSDPGELLVLHKCDVPLCVNPSHLFLGNAADNVHDALNKGRFKPGFKNRNPRAHAILTEEDVRVIRSTTPYRGFIKALAKRYGICTKAISDVIKRESWADVA